MTTVADSRNANVSGGFRSLPEQDEADAIRPIMPRMEPVSFGGCFGWYHPATDVVTGDVAVVLCSGVGRDASNAHRQFRLLANGLGAQGYPTLRFDYEGTGDSLELDGAECWEAWQGNVQAAADWLRRVSGAESLVLVGLRLGATLAAIVAAARDDVRGLVMLEPVLRGRSFISQLSVESRLRASVETRPEGGVTLNELSLSAETVERLSELDLRQVRPGADHVSLFTQYESPLLSACRKAWRDGGADVTCLPFSGLEGFLRPSHLADEPSADLQPILSWLRDRLAPVVTRRMARSTLPARTLRPADCVEIPVPFGQRRRLFGMLCRPRDAASDRVVLIANTGGDPHHGFARFSVEFARRLAGAGICSFRFDFAGLGDSEAAASNGIEDCNHVFTVDRTPDIAASLDELERQGFRRFALNGLCSGAYHAWQGALAETRVSDLLLVNLPCFSLRVDRPGPGSAARRGMRNLAERGVRTLLLFGGGDAGLDALDRHFGEAGKELLTFPGMHRCVSHELDHDLTTGPMREIAARQMIGFLQATTSDGAHEPSR